MGAESQIAVIGAGIVGLSTAYALRRRGAAVAVFDPTPGMGQSAGGTRIFRHQHEDASLIPLARDARAGWERWGEELGVRLVGTDGTLLAAAPEVLAERAERLGAAGLECLVADPARQSSALPLLRPPTDLALLDPRGGVIHAAAAIDALAGALRDDLRPDRVEGCREEAGEAVLLTAAGPRRFGKAIICAGVATPALASQIGVEVSAEVEWHARISYPLRAPPTEVPACWQDRAGTHGETAYGTPVPDDAAFAIGLTGEGVDLGVTDEGLIAHPADLAQIAARTTEYVRRVFPGLEPRPVAYRLCQSVSLPDGPDDVRVWSRGPFTCVVGGNLFKMAPALGAGLADAATGGRLPERLLPAART
jgi:sarcosine oxidase